MEQIKYISDQEKFPRTFHEDAYNDRMILFQKYYKETLGADGPALITMARTRTLYECASILTLAWNFLTIVQYSCISTLCRCYSDDHRSPLCPHLWKKVAPELEQRDQY
jgi:hypothetical protein